MAQHQTQNREYSKEILDWVSFVPPSFNRRFSEREVTTFIWNLQILLNDLTIWIDALKIKCNCKFQKISFNIDSKKWVTLFLACNLTFTLLVLHYHLSIFHIPVVLTID